MQFVAIFFEIIILSFAVYIYLYSTGKLTVKDPEKQKKIDEIRKENGTWMRLLSLLLIALMSVELFLNISSLF